jgi:hypothetical protein
MTWSLYKIECQLWFIVYSTINDWHSVFSCIIRSIKNYFCHSSDNKIPLYCDINKAEHLSILEAKKRTMHSIFLENLFLAQIKVLCGYFFLYIYLTKVSRSCQGVFNGKYDLFTLLFFFKKKKKRIENRVPWIWMCLIRIIIF